MKTNESITSNLKSEIPIQVAKTGIYSQGGDSAIEAMKDINKYNRELGESKKKKMKDETIIRKPLKKGVSSNLVGNVKMNKPIGQLFSVGKETEEGMGASAAGGYSQPLFGETKEELKKVEATEATGASSAGAYATPAAWSKSLKKKDWRGASKTQIPGGKFVQVKKKCKKFPYCNQGDIKALKIFENETLLRVIKTISQKHNISENVIKTIIVYEYENNGFNITK